jgi:hypothetical protein
MYNFTSPPLDSDSAAGDSASYASVDINKPRWLNAFTREKERWTEPTKDLDNVAFATVRTERICIEDDDAKIGVAILLILDEDDARVDVGATILVKADWINDAILLLGMS